MFEEKINQLFRDLISQWNIAERRIKKAEQLGGAEVVSPAIFELRYAGRKMIDAMILLSEKDWKNDQEVYNLIVRNLADAIEDCVKAKHDAIDAMLDFVTVWFKELEQDLGLHRLTGLFPDYLDQTGRIAVVQDKIAQSRQDRIAGRDGIYDQIEVTDYDGILNLFHRMKQSKERVQAVANRARNKEILNMAFVIIGTIAGVTIAIFEAIKFFGHH